MSNKGAKVKPEFAVENIEQRKKVDNDNDDDDGPNRYNSVIILGEEKKLDKHLQWRLKVGYRGVVVCSVIALLSFILADVAWENGFQIITVVSILIGIAFLSMILYKNISFPVVKILLTEPNVLFIVLLSLIDLAINIFRPINVYSPINGAIYVIMCWLVLLIDAIKVKSRIFVSIMLTLYVLNNISNILFNTLGDTNYNVKLFTYNIGGKEYIVWKRDTQRNIYIQILSFSMSGIWIMINDKKMELMMFATGNIYRKTGTHQVHNDAADQADPNPATNLDKVDD